MKTKEIYKKKLYTIISDFNLEDNIAVIKYEGKVNFINNERILSEEWFNCASKFYYGRAIVKNDEKYNLINKEGMLESNIWFDWIFLEYVGAHVKIKNDFYLFTRGGNIIHYLRVCGFNEYLINKFSDSSISALTNSNYMLY